MKLLKYSRIKDYHYSMVRSLHRNFQINTLKHTGAIAYSYEKWGVHIKPRQIDKTINCQIALPVLKAVIKKLSISICEHRKDQYYCYVFELHYIYKRELFYTKMDGQMVQQLIAHAWFKSNSGVFLQYSGFQLFANLHFCCCDNIVFIYLVLIRQTIYYSQP